MSTNELKAELMLHLKAARELAATASEQERDFTDVERSEVARHLKAATDVKAQIKDAEPNSHRLTLDEVLKWSEGMTQKAGPAGVWSKAFDRVLSYYRAPLGSKALISPSGSVAVPSFTSTVPGVGPGAALLELAQLIPTEGLTDTDGFSYLLETVRSHAADVVAAGAKKPTSIYTVERVDDRCRVIAHLSEPIPRAYLDDIRLLRQYLDGALREGVKLAIEDQLINGTGAGENMTGLLGTELIWTQAWDSDLLTTTRKAITTLELASIAPDGWCFYPSDWEAFELLQDLAGRFYNPAQVPVDRAQRRLWGLPVALSTQMPQGVAVLADFRGSTKMWEREAVRIDWSENTYDNYTQMSDFEANLIRFRAECRIGFAVLRPAGVVMVDVAEGS
jgi:HK97 family phage major capsid protein